MVIQREFQANARRAFTYWSRLVAGGIAMLAMTQVFGALQEGRVLFFTTYVIATILCAVDGIRRAATSFAQETEEGTMGLLLLTPLSGPDLFFGKFFSVILGSLSVVLAIIPILGFSILLGGVSGGEFFRAALALVNALALITALGIVVSSTAHDVAGATTVTLLLFCILLFLFGIAAAATEFPYHPAIPFIKIPDIDYAAARKDFWISILLTQAVTFILLWRNGAKFPHYWRNTQEQTIQHPIPIVASTPFSYQDKITRTGSGRKRGGRLTQEPFEWLTLRDIAMNQSTGTVTVAAVCIVVWGVIAFPVGASVVVMFAAALVFFLCLASSRSIGRAREANALELLITTPLGVEGIIKGHFRALRRVFLWPCLIVMGGFAFMYAREEVSHLGFLSLIGFGMLSLATPWIGLWMGLRCKTPARAVWATVALVALLPRIGGCFIDLYYFIVVGLIARHQVRKHFKEWASNRFNMSSL